MARLRAARAHRVRRLFAPVVSVLLVGASATVLVAASSGPAGAAGGAISTTTNVDAGTGGCVHPATTTTDPVNCNTYAAKTDVWLSNLPQALDPGDYYFAVLETGGQPNVADDSDGMLSEDSYLDRSFRVDANGVSSLGTHDDSGNRIQVAPFKDSSKNGTFILAVCPLASYPAVASDCKYDAFHVDEATPEGGPLAGPSVFKDAAGAYDTTYTWGTTKDVDRTTVHQIGGSATFNYTVGVSHDSGTNGNVTVTGTITVFNPLDSDLTGVDVTDTLSDGITCTVTGGADATIASGDNDFAYSCSLAGLPDGQLDNTASIAWDAQDVAEGHLDAGGDSFTFSSVSFTQTNVDECVNVTDTYAGTLGTVCVGDATSSFTYSRTIAVQPGCVDYDNTATATATDTGATSTASKSVTLCGPLTTGARTIGFWSNNNGQGIITGSAKTGICPVTSELRAYSPFQDLSATATCKEVAAYVLGVIKKANASGASMNAMLKAQMLATALDVYFIGDGSTAATQKYLPYGNLGGATIDLTYVCANPLACTSIIDASSAFGGSTSLTVSQILCYAASQSNAGGTIWYGQVKATQEKAKDVFDAINNEVAFGP